MVEEPVPRELCGGGNEVRVTECINTTFQIGVVVSLTPRRIESERSDTRGANPERRDKWPSIEIPSRRAGSEHQSN